MTLIPWNKRHRPYRIKDKKLTRSMPIYRFKSEPIDVLANDYLKQHKHDKPMSKKTHDKI